MRAAAAGFDFVHDAARDMIADEKFGLEHQRFEACLALFTHFSHE
jgi:hypothetical protein